MSFSDWKQFIGHMWPRAPNYTPVDYPDLTGRVYIVTGGSSGIGYQTVRYLLQANAKVYMVANDTQKITDAVITLRTELPLAKLEFFALDFADLNTVKPGVLQFLAQEDRLDCVIHNAGVMVPPPSSGGTTKQSIDYHVGVNCVGPWLFQRLLDDILIKTSIRTSKTSGDLGRIVWVASSAHMYADRHFQWQAQSPGGGGHSLQKRYGISKAINIIQATAWSDRHYDCDTVASLSVHPGNCRTELQQGLTGLSKQFRQQMFHDAYYGAFTELYAALHPKFNALEFNNCYIVPFGQIGHARKDLMEDRRRRAELMQWLDLVTEDFI